MQLVVLVGLSKAGKTRTAFEALRRIMPVARLAAPQPGQLRSLATHPRWKTSSDPLVVWLDDLHRFITHAAPLTPAVLAELHLRPGPVTVIATLRSEQRDRLCGGDGELTRETRMLLDAARIIEMAPTSADPEESAAAAAAYPGLRQEAGLAAELAGAPALLTRYRDAVHADPDQAAVVQVVIDWARVRPPRPDSRTRPGLCHPLDPLGPATRSGPHRRGPAHRHPNGTPTHRKGRAGRHADHPPP